eukprot:SAG31_NODE_45093_length_260_cov_0.645963_1_plen_27_part_10
MRYAAKGASAYAVASKASRGFSVLRLC